MSTLSRALVLAAATAVLIAMTPVSKAEGADGKALYEKKCAMCHGADGVAKETWAKQGAKSFSDAAWQKATTDAQIHKTIEDGVPAKKMPTYKDKLTAEEITAIVKHIRTLGAAK